MANITSSHGYFTLCGAWTLADFEVFKPLLETWRFSGSGFGINSYHHKSTKKLKNLEGFKVE